MGINFDDALANSVSSDRTRACRLAEQEAHLRRLVEEFHRDVVEGEEFLARNRVPQIPIWESARLVHGGRRRPSEADADEVAIDHGRGRGLSHRWVVGRQRMAFVICRSPELALAQGELWHYLPRGVVHWRQGRDSFSLEIGPARYKTSGILTGIDALLVEGFKGLEIKNPHDGPNFPARSWLQDAVVETVKSYTR